jgi:HEAT repeat protein
MERNNDRVKLTRMEKRVAKLADLLEAEGYHTRDAANYALSAMPPTYRTEEFVTYLSDGSLTLVNGEVLATAYLEDDNHPLTRPISPTDPPRRTDS